MTSPLLLGLDGTGDMPRPAKDVADTVGRIAENTGCDVHTPGDRERVGEGLGLCVVGRPLAT